ncbi:MAG: HNH endonuclease signature motif containing protein [candidate division WOR-3 bacterium]|nr:HNH endonuclease signature motif containing protein [candidate division WOR-3 bacterium]
MEPSISQIVQSDSRIFYNYSTIRITQSRIDKGLIAIPMALVSWFPEYNTSIQVYLDDSLLPKTKTYTSYKSSTHESRIGGLAEWFRKNDIRDGDEIVIQLIDRANHIYRLIPERNFLVKTQVLQKDFDRSEDETEASDKIENLAEWTNSEKGMAVFSEYSRLIEATAVQEREYVDRSFSQAREGVPNNLRVLLRAIYKGHCQLCGFTFLKRDNTPYFEIHHIHPSIGNHPKNLAVVCANCHRQFEYANVHQEFTKDGWLRRVFFNNKEYSVNQVVLTKEFENYIKHTYT